MGILHHWFNTENFICVAPLLCSSDFQESSLWVIKSLDFIAWRTLGRVLRTPFKSQLKIGFQAEQQKIISNTLLEAVWDFFLGWTKCLWCFYIAAEKVQVKLKWQEVFFNPFNIIFIAVMLELGRSESTSPSVVPRQEESQKIILSCVQDGSESSNYQILINYCGFHYIALSSCCVNGWVLSSDCTWTSCLCGITLYWIHHWICGGFFCV